MGKRRTEFEHKDPRAMNDDDDEEDEDDLIIEEAPSKEQLESIKQRKKLVPKRKLASGGAASTITSSLTNNSPFASLKPFPISSTTTTTTSSLSNANEDAEKPSIFAGFKGFSGFKPLPVQTSSTTAATQQQPLSTITNSETMSLSSSSSTLKPFSFTATTTTTTTTTTATTPSVSLFSNGFNSTTATTANNGPTTTLTATTTTPISTDINKNGSKSSGEEEKKSETSSSKNINDMEMRFIVGLNELYQRCYGDSLPKRQYKLPADALSSGDSAYTNGSSSIDQAEAKYASLLAELNRNCSKWISKHVEESPFVILTPVFVDYFNYLILLEKSFFPDTFKQQPTTTSTTTASSLPSTTTTKSSSSTVLNGESNSNTTPFSFSNYLNGHKENSSEQTFKAPSEKKSIIDFSATTTANKEPSNEFKFTGMPALTTTATTPSTTSFKFGLANATASASETTTTASPTKMLSVTPLNTVKPQLNLPSDITPKSILTENEPKKDTTTTPLFKFGSDSNKTDLSTSSTLLGSKPSETASTIFKPFTMSTQSPFSSLVSSSSSSSNTTQNQPAATTTTTTTPSSIFSFGSGNNNQPASTTTASPFANLQAGGLAAKSATLFPSSGGIFSGFSTGGTSILGGGASTGGILGGAVAQSADAEGGDDEKEEYQPPKPESSDVKEEGSVFTKRCKLYYFSDKEKKFTDRGIGNLFLKPTPPKEGAEPSYQLIVRADNKLAQILLNVKLSKVFPVSRDGPKDISYLCLPNPPIQNVDSNVPCKFLFKVKTEQDAAELLEKLNEYKK